MSNTHSYAVRFRGLLRRAWIAIALACLAGCGTDTFNDNSQPGVVAGVTTEVIDANATLDDATLQAVLDQLDMNEDAVVVVVRVTGPAGPPGPTGTFDGQLDHGSLSGLEDDDHPQYVGEGEVSTIATDMIVDAAVTNAKINDVDPAKISPQGAGSGLDADTLDGIQRAALVEEGEADAVTTAMLADDAITTAKIADDAITTAKIADGTVTNAKINNVDPAKISPQGAGSGLDADTLDGVQRADLVEEGEADAVTTAMIADNAVTNTKVADDAITTPKLADDAITTAKIADGAVTNAKINDVDPAKIFPQGAGSGLDADTLDGVQRADLVEEGEADAVTTAMIADDAITTARLADGAVTDAKIFDVDPAKISPQGAGSGLDADTVDGFHAAGFGPLIGEVRMWAGPMSAVPTGWLVCDGTAVSRATYADLFAVIDTIYGVGDGATTFNLPDFVDRSPMGAFMDDAGIPKTSVEGSLTQTGGAATHTLTVAELPPHDHDITHTHTVTTTEGVGLLGPGGLAGAIGDETTSGPTPDRSGFTGDGDPHPILDPYIAITFIIYTGVP